MVIVDEAVHQYLYEELKKNEILYVSRGVDTKELAAAFIAVAEAAHVIVVTLSELIRNRAAWFDEYYFSRDPFEILEGKKHAHRLDFTRPIITHQVLDRRPRQLIKKIIH